MENQSGQTFTKRPHECGYCGNFVMMKILYEYEDSSEVEDTDFYSLWQVLKCPTCKEVNMIKHIYDLPDPETGLETHYSHETVFPSNNRKFKNLPKAVANSYSIAKRLSKLEPIASAVFTGRTIECVCKDILGEEYHSSNHRTVLHKMIEDLVKQQKIPDVIGKMASQIRILRNEVIHEPDADIDDDEADTLLELCEVILEYVYEFDPLLDRLKHRTNK